MTGVRVPGAVRDGRLPAWMAVALLAAATTAPAGGCSKRQPAGAPGAPGAPAPTASHVSGTHQTDKVLDTFKDAGLTPEGFAVLEPVPYGAGFCERGRIQGVDTLICEFADDNNLERGRKLLVEEWDREGIQTGVTTTAKRTLLATVDRAHHDPNGKTISQILKAFRKL